MTRRTRTIRDWLAWAIVAACALATGWALMQMVLEVVG